MRPRTAQYWTAATGASACAASTAHTLQGQHNSYHGWYGTQLITGMKTQMANKLLILLRGWLHHARWKLASGQAYVCILGQHSIGQQRQVLQCVLQAQAILLRGGHRMLSCLYGNLAQRGCEDQMADDLLLLQKRNETGAHALAIRSHALAINSVKREHQKRCCW